MLSIPALVACDDNRKPEPRISRLSKVFAKIEKVKQDPNITAEQRTAMLKTLARSVKFEKDLKAAAARRKQSPKVYRMSSNYSVKGIWREFKLMLQTAQQYFK